MRSSTRWLILSVGGCVLVIAIASISIFPQLLDAWFYRVVPIAKKADISSQWTRVAVDPSLKWTKPVEEVQFKVDPPHDMDHQFNPVLSDGTHCVIEVSLIDNRGQSYPSRFHGWIGENMYYDMGYRALAPQEYKGVGFRSNCAMEISDIKWVGYDPQQVER